MSERNVDSNQLIVTHNNERREYDLRLSQITKSLTLLKEWKAVDDNIIHLNFSTKNPNTEVTIDYIDHAINIITNNIEIKSLTDLDKLLMPATIKCIGRILRKLEYTDIEGFDKDKNQYIKSVLCEMNKNRELDDVYLMEILRNGFNDLIPDHSINSDHINSFQNLLNNMKTKPSDYKDLKLLFQKIEHQDTFYNITGIMMKTKDEKKSNRMIKISVDDINKRLKMYSFGILDQELMGYVRLNDNIFIAGGALTACLTNDMKPWSDIDVWINGSDRKEIMETYAQFSDRLNQRIKRAYLDNKIIWSVRNNVTTVYCTGFKRNIQIIRVNEDPIQAVGKFDADYIKGYLHKGSVHGTTGFLNSLITRTTGFKTELSGDLVKRVIKALIKGYDITNLCPSDNEIIQRYKTYREMIDNGISIARNIDRHDKINQRNCSDSMSIIDIVKDVTEKYYYPSYNRDMFCVIFLYI